MFLIIAGVLLFINVVFLTGSLIYTIVTKAKADITPRLSLAPSMLSSPRLSCQPQVTIYQAMVRLSGGTLPPEYEKGKPPVEEIKKAVS